MSSQPPSQPQRSQTPASGMAEWQQQLAETKRVQDDFLRWAKEERSRREEELAMLEAEGQLEEEELERLEEEERMEREWAAAEEREREECKQKEQEEAEKCRLEEEEKEKVAEWAKKKGKGKAQPQEESAAGSSRAMLEGWSRKQAREKDEDEEEEDKEVEVVKWPHQGLSQALEKKQVMGGGNICQRCHDTGTRCTMVEPKDGKKTKSCGPCLKAKKRCQLLQEEPNQPLLDINEGAMKALIDTIDNLVRIADKMYDHCESTLDLVDDYLLWKMGRSLGSLSRKASEGNEEEKEEAKKDGDEMEED